MPLLQTLVGIQLEARKNKDTEKLALMQVVLSSVKLAQIEKRKELSDEEIVEVIRRQARQLEDALVDFERGGRSDLIEKTKTELELLKSFLPVQMSVEELEHIIKRVIADTHAVSVQDFAIVMREVMSQVRGKADGKLVQQIVQRLLSQ